MTEVYYRKYRPKAFSEVVGQEAAVKILQNAISKKRLAHAYLFAGPRGTGKTTVARILAREAGAFDEDIIEIDAASSRGIDEARELREAVRSLPMRSPYKVYIIDEVHMLTKEAFNALLKTLEEPPAHAIFILATTELEKVPDTVRSRTQVFEFGKIGMGDIVGELQKIAEAEKLDAEDDALKLIAFFAEGSLRDAENLLFQIAGGGEAKISEKNARLFLGAPEEESVRGLLKNALGKNVAETLAAYGEILEDGVDPALLQKLILRDLRAAYFLALDQKTESMLLREFSKDEIDFLKELAKAGEQHLGFAFKSIMDAEKTFTDDYLKSIPLELALIKMATYSK